MAFNDVLPLKAARRDAIANLKCFWGFEHQRPNFDGYIYIHCAVPPYSARIGAIASCLATFGWVRFPCATRGKHNEEFTKGGWELWSYFKPFVGQSSRSFRRCIRKLLVLSNALFWLCVCHVSFRRYSPLSLEVVEKRTKFKRFVSPQFLWEGRLRLFYGSVLG